jgi:hypothetical protein
MHVVPGSNTTNPILFGGDKVWPALPWLYGNSECQEGDYCKICYDTLKFSGLLSEYKTVKKFRSATKKEENPPLVQA